MSDIHFNLATIPAAFTAREGRLRDIMAQGKEIPDSLLPGRMLMAMTPEKRAELSSADLLNVSDWWVKIAVGR